MDAFLAEIRMFPFSWPPKGWAHCNGQLMPISQNTALFSLLGTVYGGDGKSTFALPDLTGCSPMCIGQGSGLSNRSLGEMGGSETVTLLHAETPAHTHALNIVAEEANERQPPGQLPAFGNSIGFYDEAGAGSGTSLAPETVVPAGASLPHNNMMPFLTLSFCIALQGIFPPRS